jgi:hypothetical protein
MGSSQPLGVRRLDHPSAAAAPGTPAVGALVGPSRLSVSTSMLLNCTAPLAKAATGRRTRRSPFNPTVPQTTDGVRRLDHPSAAVAPGTPAVGALVGPSRLSVSNSNAPQPYGAAGKRGDGSPRSRESFHPNGSSIDGLCLVKNLGPFGVM